MITFKELLGSHSIADIPHSHQLHMEELLKRINVIRAKYGKPMIVTSCYRTAQRQRDIYAMRGIKNPPMGSAHLSGEAVDILDRDGALYNWCKTHPEMLEAADVYCENDTHGWVHFQIKPFGSYKPGGTRWFNP